MPVIEAYQNRKVLLTGTTGFLGKVLLEKFLYALPMVSRIYVLIRAKKGSKINERLKREILDSPCFDRLRQRYGHDFDRFIANKIHPIEGDLLKEGLGLSPTDLKQLAENCEAIINCAASIDFNARLDDAININIKGTFRMMELAKKCQRLQTFTHVSTCYVNCTLRGRIKEEIYPNENDPDLQLKSLLAIPVSEIDKRTSEVLKQYPNTYTFTKALCQRLLQKHRGSLPLCIVRPAIINASYREPHEGWVDSPAAASALFLYCGLGLVREVYGDPTLVGDNIPCDIVVDFTIVATAYHMGKNQLEVYNVGSSDRNPILWSDCRQTVNSFWNVNQSSAKLGKANVLITNNEQEFRYNRLKNRLPMVVYNRLATMLGSKEHIKNSGKVLKSLDKGYQVESLFRYFVSNEWIFESQKVNHMKNWMNESERKIFTVDVADIDMKRSLLVSNFGLQKYILKENTEAPVPSNSNLLQSSSSHQYFSDIKWALRSGSNKNQKQRTIRDYKNIVLKSPRVLEAIQNELGKGDLIDDGVLRRKVEKEADAIASEMFGEFKMSVVRFFAWALHKIFKSIYEKIYIDEEMLERLRKIEEQTSTPIVLAPTQRSYLDFLIVSYIFFVYRLKMPNVASDEVLLRTTLIPSLLRSSGGFFVKNDRYKKSKLYRAILTEYVEVLLTEGNNLEFFIQGHRSRTGKLLAPQLNILSIIVDAVMDERVADVCIVPLTINYEKVLEGDTFPEELLGEEKVEQSLLRVVKAAKLLRVNYGRVYIQFCEPIMFHNYVKEHITADFNPYKRREQRKQLIENLGYYIVHRLSEKIVIMSTSVVSAVLLMNRKGITEDFLISGVHWLSKEILARGFRIGGINKSSPNIAVRNAIAHLENITVRTKKNVFELQISADEEYKKLLMLSYYRNALTHVFLPEAFIGFALVSFGSQMAYREGVELDRLMEQTLFISKMLHNEYIHPVELKTELEFARTLRQMCERRIVNEQKDPPKICIDIRSDKLIHFYCSFLSPLAEAYWATMQYMLSTKYQRDEKNVQVSLGKFEEYVQWHVESLYDEKVVYNYEACSLETLKNAIKTYELMGLLNIREGKEKKVEVVASEERLAELQSHLHKFILNTKPISSPELLSRSVRYDLLGSKL